jgi:hypothetical protein
MLPLSLRRHCKGILSLLSKANQKAVQSYSNRIHSEHGRREDSCSSKAGLMPEPGAKPKLAQFKARLRTKSIHDNPNILVSVLRRKITGHSYQSDEARLGSIIDTITSCGTTRSKCIIEQRRK